MKSSSGIVKINFKGGIVPPEKLRMIINVMNKFYIHEAFLGSRQNIYFFTDKYYVDSIAEKLRIENIDFEIDRHSHPNIVSSYTAVDLFAPSSWLNESIFREILDTFDYHPNLKITIVDINQGLVTAFDSDLCFIASHHINFWYLYVKSNKDKKFICWPSLIYSTDLGAMAKELERQNITSKKNIDDEAFINVKAHLKYISIEKDAKLSIPRYILPNYEGIHRNGDRSWLGINNRGAKYSPEFFESLTLLCIGTDISSIYLTPWRNIIIKNIKEIDIIKWEVLLGKYGINIRHSSLELNWKIEDFDFKSERLKKYLIKKFDKTDIRTYGLTFAIKGNDNSDITSSIIIRRNSFFTVSKKLRLFPIYRVYRAEDFNPNKRKLLFEGNYFSKSGLAGSLKSLCKKYYKQLGAVLENAELNEPDASEDLNMQDDQKITSQDDSKINVYECKHCFTVYDEKYGDVINGIRPGISFKNLAEDYACPVCGAAKNDFRAVRKNLVKEFEKD